MALFGRPNVAKLQATGNIPSLIAALAYKGPDALVVRKAASLALGELRATAALEPLCRALDDHDAGIRAAAAQALRLLGDTRAVDPFIRALKDPSASVQEQAAWALGELNNQRAVEPLLAALYIKVPQGVTRAADRAISQAIIKLAGNQVEPLIAILKGKKRGVWEDTVAALEKLNDQRAVAPLVEVVLDNEATWAARRAALTVLETLGWGPTEESHRLIYAIAHQQWASLGGFGVAAIEPLLSTLQSNEPWDTQQRAITWLVELRATNAVGPLVDLVRGIDQANARRFPPKNTSTQRGLNEEAQAGQQAAIHAIQTLLEHTLAEVPTEGLRKILLLSDDVPEIAQLERQEQESGAEALFGPKSAPMPRAHMKHLARLELHRRGLKG
jgi:HEAT repeat protein